MPAGYDWNRFFRQAMASTISMAKSGKFNFYRPDYTSALTPETLLRANVDAQLDSDSSVYSKTKVSGVQYFSLFFDRYIDARAGDVVVRNPVHDTPAITILECEDLQQCVGFKTSGVGAVYISRPTAGTPAIDNVRFNYATAPQSPESAINPDDPASMPVEQRRIITWNRPGIKAGRFFKDTATGKLYSIIEVQGDGNLLICFMDIPSKRS
jgi:hypothetical protein